VNEGVDDEKEDDMNKDVLRIIKNIVFDY